MWTDTMSFPAAIISHTLEREQFSWVTLHSALFLAPNRIGYVLWEIWNIYSAWVLQSPCCSQRYSVLNNSMQKSRVLTKFPLISLSKCKTIYLQQITFWEFNFVLFWFCYVVTWWFKSENAGTHTSTGMWMMK